MIKHSWIFLNRPLSITLRYFSRTRYRTLNKIVSSGLPTKALSTSNQSEILKAKTIASIVKLIADSHDWHSIIEKKSLVDRIIQIIEQDIPAGQETQILSFFKGGVEYDNFIFNQIRIQQAQRSGKIIFCPTTLVTSQIFNLILNKVHPKQKILIYSGLFGTSKTLSLMLYCKLAAIVNQVALSGIPQEIRQHILIPKMIYISMYPENFIEWAKISEEQFVQGKNPQRIKLIFHKKAWRYFAEIILRQFQYLKNIKLELSAQQLQDIKTDPTLEFKIKIQAYGRYYLKKQAILLVDQFNQIISQIKKFQNGQYQGSNLQEMKIYFASMALNDVRASVMNHFNRTIFINSSSSPLIIEKHSQSLLKQLKTFPHLHYNGIQPKNFVDLSYMDYFNFRFNKAFFYQLCDIILFEMQNFLGEIDYNQLVYSSQKKQKQNKGLTAKQIVRKQGYILIRRYSANSNLTSMLIRQGVNRYFYKKGTNFHLYAGNRIKVFRQILKQCAKISTKNFRKALNKYIQKGDHKIYNFRKKIIRQLYRCASLQSSGKIRKGNKPVVIVIQEPIQGMTMKETIDKAFDKNLFDIDEVNNRLISLLPSRALLKVINQEEDLKQ